MGLTDGHEHLLTCAVALKIKENKAGYTAQDAPSTRLKNNYGRKDGRTDRQTQPLVEM